MHRLLKRFLRPALMGFICVFAWGCGGGGGDSPPPSFTVSGSIYAAAGNAVHQPPGNTFETAQTLSPPVILGGFVQESDPVHFFQATLPADSTIRLALSDPIVPDTQPQAQVELYLYRIGHLDAPVDELRAIGQTKALTVETAGDYFIEVRAVSGATIYRLVVDMPSAFVSGAGLGTSMDFVPGEVLVKLDTDVDALASTRVTTDFARRLGLRMVQGAGDGWMRLRADNMENALTQLNLPRRRLGDSDGSEAADITARHRDTLRMIEALRAHPEVVHAEPNYIRRLFFEPDDPLFPLQWNLELINLPAAWDLNRGDANVIVAVIDTGVLAAHPDLEGQLVPGYDFISNDSQSGDGEPGIDPNPEDPGGGSGFHGTHVAGIVAAASNNSIGVAGVGGATRVMPVRALGGNGGTDADVANAILWAAGLNVVGVAGTVIEGANPPADIINMSFGGPFHSQVILDAVRAARAAGAILIAAAGNRADTAPIYPAAHEEVIAVSAVDAYARRAYYSSYGPRTIAAPGGNLHADSQPNSYADGILSTLGSEADGTIAYVYGYFHGTSMAAPHVAGVAALMKAVRPAMTPDEFDSFIVSGDITADLDAPDLSDRGYGLIDAYAAVLRARLSDPPPDHLTVTPAALRLDDTAITADLYLRSVGSGVQNLVTIIQPDWVTAIEPGAGQTWGEMGRYRITIDRGRLPGGIHKGVISFITASDIVTRLPLTIDVLPDPTASAGTQYLLLIDAATLSPVAQQILSPVNGEYAFEFTEVAAGTYFLLTGSDLNDNRRINDSGEAVGGYPSLQDHQPIPVQADVTGLRFVTGFNKWPLMWPAHAPLNVQRAP